MGYTALYRRYRPMVFDQVVGQQHVTTTLKNQINGGRIAHAYLFAGTRGTGKTSTARILARAVNCLEAGNGNPCNECKICQRAISGKLIDIIEIDAASNRGVDEIRDLREKVKFPPAEGRYRVYIVDEVHMLTAEAFNALLKTLEEPPSHVIFILATTEPHRLPATVLSRCQRFDFKRLSVAEIIELMEHVVNRAGIRIDRDAMELIAGSVDGAARDALSLLDQCSTFDQGALTLERVSSILGMAHDEMLFGVSEGLAYSDAAGCLKLLDRAAKEGRDTGQLFKDIIHHLRDILIAKILPSGLADMANEKKEKLLELSGRMQVNTLIRAINVLAEAQSKARWSSYPAILLEVAVVKICEPSMDESLEGLKDRISRLEDILYKGHAANTDRRDGGSKEKSRPEPADTDQSSNPEGKTGEKKAESDQKTETAKKNVYKDICMNIDLEQITDAWDRVLKHLQSSKRGLYTLIKSSRPMGIRGDTLVIGCKSLHGIYQDITNSEENRKALAQAVHLVTGQKVKVKIESSDGRQAASKKDSEKKMSLFEEAVDIFGSDIVENLGDKDN